ncbi:hypothetical protein F4810DRAFT_505712 [Camillea tinctor]|nr:hypothetical protein F4810DRAFT_505712 [Camillea tinctor]
MYGQYDALEMELWSFLSTRLGTKYERTGSLDDKTCVREILGRAIEDLGSEYVGENGWLTDLGYWFVEQYKKSGNTDHLNCSIEIAKVLIERTSESHPTYLGLFISMGHHYFCRYTGNQSVANLNHALEATRLAVEMAPREHPCWSKGVINLNHISRESFDRTRSKGDLDYAISSAELCLSTGIVTEDSIYWTHMLEALRLAVKHRALYTGSLEDMDRAIELLQIELKA